MEGDFTPLKTDIEAKKNKKRKKIRGLLSEDPSKSEKTKVNNKDSLHSEIPDPIKGNPKVAPSKLEKYNRGEGDKKFRQQAKKRKRHEDKIEKAKEAAARAELLLHEQAGFIERADPEDDDSDEEELTQDLIKRSVDITSAQKIFDLKLHKLGPYRHRFTRNGRFLLLGGSTGHLAAFDWQTKGLQCELSVNETVHDVTWLQNETMFAAAQKAYTCIYDNKGVELHCLRRIDHATRLEFLPYHFLLTAGNSKGYLNYLDVSVGKFVGGMQTGAGPIKVMTQNPKTGVILVGTPQGTVSFWSPASSKYLATVLCGHGAVKAITSSHCGNYFATSGMGRVVAIWDVRMMSEMRRLKHGQVASQISFSQTNKLAVAFGPVLNIYPENVIQEEARPFLTHRVTSPVTGLQFCPFEDVLGVSHGDGYSSLLIPGSGEANFDALESNPYQSKKMRQEAEVKALLEKVGPEMITLETDKILDVDVDEMKRKLAERKKINYVKVPELDFTPRRKKKGRSSAGNKLRRSQMVKANHQRLLVKGDKLNEKLEKMKKKKDGEETKDDQKGKNTKRKSKLGSYALKRFAAKS